MKDSLKTFDQRLKTDELFDSLQVAKENGTTLPQAALFIIRYHSFYRTYFFPQNMNLDQGFTSLGTLWLN